MTPPAPSPPSVPFALPVRNGGLATVVDNVGIELAVCVRKHVADAIVRALNAFYCPSAQATTHNQP